MTDWPAALNAATAAASRVTKNWPGRRANTCRRQWHLSDQFLPRELSGPRAGGENNEFTRPGLLFEQTSADNTPLTAASLTSFSRRLPDVYVISA